MRPCRWRYISNALAERSRADHWMSSNGVPTSVGVRQQDEVLHVEDARRLVGPLEHAGPSWQKCQASPCVIVASVTPDEQLAGQLDLVEELVRIVERGRRRAAVADHQVELVDLLPHLGRDDLAHGAGVLARGAQAGEDRIGVLGDRRSGTGSRSPASASP